MVFAAMVALATAGPVNAADWTLAASIGGRYFGTPQGTAYANISGSPFDNIKLKGEWAHRIDTQTRTLSVSTRLWDAISVSSGYQIEKWGVADFLRGVDAINPVDLRNPGQLNLEDARMGIWTSKVTYQNDTLRLEAIAIHQTQSDRTDRVYPSGPTPIYTADSTGLGLRALWSIDQLELELSSLDHLDPVRRHRLGAAAQYLSGPATFKAEYAFDESEIVALGGVDYALDDNITVVIEGSRRWDRLGSLPIIDSHAVMFRWDSDSDTLHFSWFASGSRYFVSTHRIQIEHDVSDHLRLTTGVLLVNNGRDILGVPFTYEDTLFGAVTLAVL